LNDFERAKTVLKGAEYILVGGGSGLSAAAGLTYSGARFKKFFSDFIERYRMTDMYSAGFYPFSAQEEKWAYWSKHIFVNRYLPPALPLYRDLFSFLENKNYFVITTNVDHQFYKAGFQTEKIFAVQGDYGKFQCANGCHSSLYDNEAAVREMVRSQKDCRIPASLVPVCPVCGADMEVHIRKDARFVQDDAWYETASRYDAFVNKARQGKTVLLELGVGFNTPAIIQFPFERFVCQNRRAHLIRANLDDCDAIPEITDRTISLCGSLSDTLKLLFC
jgi:hypothetical protein